VGAAERHLPAGGGARGGDGVAGGPAAGAAVMKPVVAIVQGEDAGQTVQAL
jgi:hypothetical protein